jgi:hypothetical protein
MLTQEDMRDIRQTVAEENTKAFAAGLISGTLLLCISIITLAYLDSRNTRAIITRL